MLAKVAEKSPDLFARGIGRLTDLPVSVKWAYQGPGLPERDEVTLCVSVRKLQALVFTHSGSDENRGGLVRLAREAARGPRDH